MKFSVIINLFLILFFFCFLSCREKTEGEFVLIDHALDSNTKAKYIPFKILLNNYPSLDGQIVETEGIFNYSFEDISICTVKSTDLKCFWVDFSQKLNEETYMLLRKVSGQRLRIKGTIDTSDKGHLGSYLATLKDVYYIKRD